MSNVVKLFPAPGDEGLAKVADNEHNRNRDDQGPPIGSSAWVCLHCDDFAFYVTTTDIRCYRCHRPQDFT